MKIKALSGRSSIYKLTALLKTGERTQEHKETWGFAAERAWRNSQLFGTCEVQQEAVSDNRHCT